MAQSNQRGQLLTMIDDLTKQLKDQRAKLVERSVYTSLQEAYDDLLARYENKERIEVQQ